MQIVDGKFTDYRWKNGAWDLESDAFKGKEGKTNWDLVRQPCPINRHFASYTASESDAVVLEDKWKGWHAPISTASLAVQLLSVCSVAFAGDRCRDGSQEAPRRQPHCQHE